MKIKKIIKAIIICFILNLTIILSTKLTNVNAAISLDLQNSYFTESDSFTYLNSTYTIFDYKNSIETQGGLFASNVELLENYSQWNVFGDDPIIKIIPKEYFHTIGSFSYIGKEYGYFIQTVNEICYSSYENENTGNYRSYIIVFDIEANTDLYANVDKAIFTVRVLFELEFITIKNTVSTIWRKSDASQTESIDDEIDYNIVTAINNNSNLQYCVVPLFDANRNAKTNRYYLNDVSFAGTLQNEQELNETDSSYVLIDDYGSYFTRMDYVYNGIIIENGSWDNVNREKIFSIIIETAVDTLISKYASKLSTIINIGKAVIKVSDEIQDGISDKEYNISNDIFSTHSYYMSRENQINRYGHLAKLAYFVMNSDKNYSILYGTDNSVRIEYTINHGKESDEEANYTRLRNEIALKIVDRNKNVISCVKNSNSYNLREPIDYELKLDDSNKIYLLENGKNYYKFTPSYSGDYELTINGNKLIKMNFDGDIKESTNISFKKHLKKGKTYYITIENLSTDGICNNFSFCVSNNYSNINIDKYDDHIIKINEKNGFKKIIFNNPNVKMKILDSNLNILKDGDVNNLYYKLRNENYYVVINNETEFAVNGTLSITNENRTLVLGQTTTIYVEKGDKFYSFTPTKTAKYSIVVFDNTSASYTFSIYTDTATISPVVYYCNSYVRYDYNFEANVKYYIGYEGATAVNGDLNITINEIDSVYKFYINNILVNNIIYLTQDDEFTLEVKINDIILNDYEMLIFDASEYLVRKNNRYKILADASISTSSSCKIAIIDSEKNILDFIEIVILPRFEISVTDVTYSEENRPNYFYIDLWLLSSQISAKIYYSIIYNDGTVYTSFVELNSTKTSECVAVPTMSYNVNTVFAKIDIQKIEFTQNWSNISGDKRATYYMTFTNSNQYSVATGNFDYQYDNELYEINTMFNGGTGSENDPYKISNEWQLNNVRYMTRLVRYDDDSDYMITDNFVVTRKITVNNEFEPLPILRGRFESDSSTSREIELKKLLTGSKYTGSGLFMWIWNGTVNHIIVNVTGEINSSGANIIRKGAICGYMVDGTISNCEAMGSFSNSAVNPLSSTIGGIVGEVGRGSIINCENKMLIDTYGTAGGIAGRSYFAEINNCSNSGIFKLQYIVGSITKENDNPSIGGIVGHLVSTSSVINCKLNNNNEMIIYCGEKCKDIMLSPCLGLIVGRNVGGQIVRYDIEHQVTINSGNLQEFKTGGFLGINAKTYNQARYVSNNNEMPCGKVG